MKQMLRNYVSAMTGRRAGHVAALVATCIVFGAAAAPATAQPAWKIDSLANSTAAPGGTTDFLIQLTNVGDAVADGTTGDPIVLTATLPPGMTAQDVTYLGTHVFDFFTGGWSCTGDGGGPIPGSSTVTCSMADAVGDRANGAPFSFQDLGPVSVIALTANVDPSATGTLTASFQVSGAGAAGPATTVDPTRISDATPTFGVDAFDGLAAADAAGNPLSQAGGHPYSLTTSVDWTSVLNPAAGIGYRFTPTNAIESGWSVEAPKDAVVDLPPGFVGNPANVPQCTFAQLANGGQSSLPLCPPDSQVGTVTLRANNTPAFGETNFGPVPVYNMVPSPSKPATFGFNVLGSPVLLNARLRSDSDYGLSIDVRSIAEALPISGSTFTFWGVPSDSSHDFDRACPGLEAPWDGGGPSCQSGAARAAFFRLPTSCTAPGTGLTTVLHTDSWLHGGRFRADGSADLSDPNWKSASFVSHENPGYPYPSSAWGAPLGVSGCDKVPFKPSLEATSGSSRAGAPSGFTFDLKAPQSDNPDTNGEADLKTASVTLPNGVHVSPSSAFGLGGCSAAQIGLIGTGFAEPNPIRFTTAPPSCPDSSKLGTVRIDTPLLREPLTGSIYLASPGDNPFHSLLAIYLVAQGQGVTLKLPGKIEPDSSTGQLTATFDHNPQLPFSDLQLAFKSGPRAPLVNPPSCGTYTTHAVLSSWAGRTVSSDSSFTISQGEDGGPCPSAGFSPGFTAGTENPLAGKDTSFLLDVSRGDRDQQLGGITVDMPSGVTGRIANAVLCSDGQAAAGTCTSGSQVGTIAVGAGAGPTPFWITNGRAYLTGPYKGAPFGLSMVVPAVAGPFDLGNVVVRAAIYVDRTSARLRVVSDALPTILQGIPLDLREVRVAVDRPHFIVNPTSCAVKHVYGTFASTLGAIAHAATRFQVGECASLSLAPKLTLTVGSPGHTGGGRSTPLTTTLTQTPGQANLRTVSVELPTTLNARLAVLNRACTQAQFAAGHCAGARAGSAVALTPLLRDPLRGSAYFVRNPHRLLPDLVVALRGQVAVDLVGKVGVNPRTNQLTTRFDTIPDVPITRFTLRLVAGANGPLGVVTNLCSAKARRATAALGFRGQNGMLLQVDQRLRIRGCPRGSGR
jgi:hypothetical protein